MKKLISLVITAVLLLTAFGVLAEEGQLAPLYATVGDALEDDAEGRVVFGGIPGQYYAVVNLKDGQYYRSVANYDEQLIALEEALDTLDYEADDFFEKHEAATQAISDYLRALPIAYSEVFTAQPLTDEEMAAVAGKTLAQLMEEGFETGDNGTELGENDEALIVYTLRCGVFDYYALMDCDIDQYLDAKDNDTEGDLAVKDITLMGITERGFDKRFHTDGTVEAPVDPFAEFNAVMEEIVGFIQKIASGEETDFEAFAETMKAQYPDYADMIETYVTLYQTYGAEGLLNMMQSAQ